MGTRRTKGITLPFKIIEPNADLKKEKELARRFILVEPCSIPFQPRDGMVAMPRFFPIRDCDQILVLWPDGQRSICHTDP